MFHKLIIYSTQEQEFASELWLCVHRGNCDHDYVDEISGTV